MATPTTLLHERITSGKPILVLEIAPPRGGDPTPLREAARRLAGRVHAVGVSDNRDRVGMAALAAASLVAAEDVEPILHVVTRDRNRIALVSELLGAQALGIRNVLCTSGTHQTLGRFRAAKNVFDLDSVQLLQMYAELGSDGTAVGEEPFDGVGPFCLGATASPDADPMELQMIRLAKKVRAGAQFVITEAVYDLERFAVWCKEAVHRGLDEKAAILAGIRVLTSAAGAKACAVARPRPLIPEAVLGRITSASSASGERAAGIAIARETIAKLADTTGVRGFCLFAEDLDAACEVLETSGQGGK